MLVQLWRWRNCSLTFAAEWESILFASLEQSGASLCGNFSSDGLFRSTASPPRVWLELQSLAVSLRVGQLVRVMSQRVREVDCQPFLPVSGSRRGLCQVLSSQTDANEWGGSWRSVTPGDPPAANAEWHRVSSACWAGAHSQPRLQMLMKRP